MDWKDGLTAAAIVGLGYWGLTKIAKGPIYHAETFESNEDIGNTIYRQLGGNRFRLMTGAKNLTWDDKNNELSMKIGKNNLGANYFVVKLTPMDLYDIRFESRRWNRKTYDLNIKVKAEYTNIYADQLQNVFTEATGLYTRMAESFSTDESNAYQVITTDWKSSMEPKDRYNNDEWFITGDISFATPDSSGNYGRGVETISVISTFGEGLTKESAKEDAINRATLYLYHDVIGYKNAETFEAKPMKAISNTRSYWNMNHTVWSADSKAARKALKEKMPDYKFGVRIEGNGQTLLVYVKEGKLPKDINTFTENVKKIVYNAVAEGTDPYEMSLKSIWVQASDSDFNAESHNFSQKSESFSAESCEECGTTKGVKTYDSGYVGIMWTHCDKCRYGVIHDRKEREKDSSSNYLLDLREEMNEDYEAERIKYDYLVYRDKRGRFKRQFKGESFNTEYDPTHVEKLKIRQKLMADAPNCEECGKKKTYTPAEYNKYTCWPCKDDPSWGAESFDAEGIRFLNPNYALDFTFDDANVSWDEIRETIEDYTNNWDIRGLGWGDATVIVIDSSKKALQDLAKELENNYSGYVVFDAESFSAEESEGARCMRRLDEMFDSMQEFAEKYLTQHPVDGYSTLYPDMKVVLPSDDHHDYTEVADGMVKDTTDAQQMASEMVLRAMEMRDMADDLGGNIEYDAESHAYSYAYNEGHSDSRKTGEYHPSLSTGSQEANFKRILKQKE